MAQFKDLLVAGDARVVGKLYAPGTLPDGVYHLASVSGTAAVTTSPYTSAKWQTTANDPRITELYSGLTVSLKIPVAGNGNYGTVLDVNGLGYHPVVYNINSMISTRYGVGSTITLVYNATQTATGYDNSASATTYTGCWQMEDYDSTNIYQIKDNYANTTVKDVTGNILYRYELCLFDKDGYLIPYNNTSNATSTYTKNLNSLAFDPFQPIMYYSSKTDLNPGTNLSDALFSHIVFDVRYSMNINSSGTAGSTALTAYKPIYIKALYDQATGTATLINNTSATSYLDRSSIVQALPTTNPNTGLSAGTFYIYIYLGKAISKYQLELEVLHPVYAWSSTSSTCCIYGGNALSAADIGAATSGHTHTLTMASDSGTSALDMVANTKYKLTAGGNTFIFKTPTDNNTTYTFATGDGDGQFKVTPSGGSAQNITIKNVATLDSNGKVPSSQLPAYVDDVIEYANVASFPSTGEAGKIYVALDTNKTYRWSGSEYVEISASLALGETSSTAYRGDRGKTAYDHSQSTHARTDATKTEASSTNGKIKINGTDTTVYTHPSYTAQSAAAKKVGLDATGHVVLGDSLTKSDVGLGNVGNFLAVSTVAGQGLTEEQQQAARANIGAGQSGLTLGTGSNNAYYGDRGETAYTHAIVYATCDTAKGTATKVATVVGDVPFTLVTGRVVVVSFTNGNEYNGTATLKVGTADAKNIYYNGTTANSRYMWAAGENVAFIYDGTQYRMLDGGLGSTTYYGAVKLQTSATSTSTSLALTPSSLNAFSENTISGAPIYSSSSTYAIGDYVRYNYQTWKCTTAITTAESWNADHWEALPAIQTQLDEGIGKVDTSIAAANQTYYLTGVTTTSATSKDQLYNTRLSNSFTGVKYQTSTSAQGGTLTVDEREVTLGLHYEIS